MYRGYGIAFDGAGSRSFGNDVAGNSVIFRVGKCLSSHTDNRKNIFLMLGEGSTDDINGSVGAAEKSFCIKFNKARTKFC